MGQAAILGFSRRIRVGFSADPGKIQGIYEWVNVLRKKGAIAISVADFGMLEMANCFGFWGGDGNRSVVLYIEDRVNISYVAECLRTKVEWFEILEWKVDDDK